MRVAILLLLVFVVHALAQGGGYGRRRIRPRFRPGFSRPVRPIYPKAVIPEPKAEPVHPIHPKPVQRKPIHPTHHKPVIPEPKAEPVKPIHPKPVHPKRPVIETHVDRFDIDHVRPSFPVGDRFGNRMDHFPVGDSDLHMQAKKRAFTADDFYGPDFIHFRDRTDGILFGGEGLLPLHGGAGRGPDFEEGFSRNQPRPRVFNDPWNNFDPSAYDMASLDNFLTNNLKRQMGLPNDFDFYTELGIEKHTPVVPKGPVHPKEPIHPKTPVHPKGPVPHITGDVLHHGHAANEHVGPTVDIFGNRIGGHIIDPIGPVHPKEPVHPKPTVPKKDPSSHGIHKKPVVPHKPAVKKDPHVGIAHGIPLRHRSRFERLQRIRSHYGDAGTVDSLLGRGSTLVDLLNALLGSASGRRSIRGHVLASPRRGFVDPRRRRGRYSGHY